MTLRTCECGKDFRYKVGRSLVCSCGNRISPLVGTIVEGSRAPLKKWLFALFLFSQSKNGVSAKELQRQLGVTYKTAWRMGHKIRELMVDNEVNNLSGGSEKPLHGVVEADETYIGGRVRGSHGGRGTTKTALFGMVEREGRAKVRMVPNVKANTVLEHIVCNVDKRAHMVTDEFPIYNYLYRHGYKHDKILHRSCMYGYVNDSGFNVHTNTIEGLWAIIKRAIKGTHIYVSKKHLQSYLNERVFFYNYRNSDRHLFHVLLSRVPASLKVSENP